MLVKNGKYRKIRVLKDLERASYYTGEMMGWKAGQFEEGYVDESGLEVEINWG